VALSENNCRPLSAVGGLTENTTILIVTHPPWFVGLLRFGCYGTRTYGRRSWMNYGRKTCAGKTN